VKGKETEESYTPIEVVRELQVCKSLEEAIAFFKKRDKLKID